MAEEVLNLPEHQGTPSTSLEGTRPVVSRQWQTERPQPATKISVFATQDLGRHATNTFMLNEAISNGLAAEDNSTSSSSENDEDSSVQQPRHRLGRHRTDSKGGQGTYSRFNVRNDNFETKGKVSKRDGRLDISLNETNNTGYLAKALGASFLKHLGPSSDSIADTPSSRGRAHSASNSRTSSEATRTSDIPRPKLTIVVR